MSDQGFPPPPPPPPPGGGVPPPPPPPGGYAQPAQLTAERANFGQRLGAWIIDALILGVPGGIVQFVAGQSVPTELVSCDSSSGICEQPTAGGFAIIGLVSLALIGVGIWYYGQLEGVRGQTVGKSALGIKVVGVDSGQPIGFGRGVGRYFSRILSLLPCALGYFWMLWDPQKQTWHDKIVRSYVVRA